MLSPSAFLHDFITDPERSDLSMARRMVLKLTGRIPDANRALEMNERLNRMIQAVVNAIEVGPDFYAIHEAQTEARTALEEVERMGRQ